MIEIFQNEIKDGLGDLINSSHSIAYVSDVIKSPSFGVDINFESIASLDNAQIDLYYLYSILATLGWNLNDDIFLREEVVSAKDTPVDKPFNKMHNQDDIICHMTASNLLSTDYQPADDQNFEHIAVNSVIYKAYRDPKKREEILQLIDEIEDGKWKVSMECLFSNFDYGIIRPDGSQAIIKRTPETSYLTKYLRAYKGAGTYEDKRIGRVLRNITFSGKGLVSEPGNPYSIIFNSNKKFFGTYASTDEFKEKQMNETEKLAFEQMQASLQSAQAELAAYKVAAAQEAENKLKSAVAERDEQIAALRADLATVTASLAQANANLEVEKVARTETVANLEIASAKLAKIEAEATEKTRKEALAKVVPAERIESVFASVKTFDENSFNSFIETLASLKPQTAPVTPKVEPEVEPKVVTTTVAQLDNAQLDADVFNTQADLNKSDAKFKGVVEFMKSQFNRNHSVSLKK